MLSCRTVHLLTSRWNNKKEEKKEEKREAKWLSRGGWKIFRLFFKKITFFIRFSNCLEPQFRNFHFAIFLLQFPSKNSTFYTDKQIFHTHCSKIHTFFLFSVSCTRSSTYSHTHLCALKKSLIGNLTFSVRASNVNIPPGEALFHMCMCAKDCKGESKISSLLFRLILVNSARRLKNLIRLRYSNRI